MKKVISMLCGCLLTIGTVAYAQVTPPQVVTRYGTLQGVNESGINVFKGVPFAAPPVGANRWRAPQPLQAWSGVRMADKFGDDPMQGNPFGDMGFSAEKKSEDCLYLNIWTPAKTMDEKLPVLIYFNGGGLIAGSGSEPRYAGASMARHGIVSITANYREGIFGFFSHPELSKESGYNGSGNYGFMDQAAAIRWVYENIAAFGGDPTRITIAGESAGSMSVSALLVSPLTQGMISKAIASSGSVCGRKFSTLQEAEAIGVQKLEQLHVKSVAEARALSAEKIQNMAQSGDLPPYCVDGYVFHEMPETLYRQGKQQRVPLLVGRNSMEMTVQFYLRGKASTLANLRSIAVQFYGEAHADEVMQLYGLLEDKDVDGKPGVDFASDLFIAYGTWLFGYLHAQTSEQPVYRYYFSHPRPDMVQKGIVAGLAGGIAKADDAAKTGKDKVTDIPATESFKGAVHSADIEYAMGTLSTNRVYDWQPDDYAVSAQFIAYYANFIKTGNPNGLDLADWNPINGEQVPNQLILDVNSYQVRDKAFEDRYLYLMRCNSQK